MTVAGKKLLYGEAKRWFKEREHLIAEAGNRPEMEHRLRWLSEGALHYHINDKEIRGGTDGGCPKEVRLFKDFVEYSEELKGDRDEVAADMGRRRKGSRTTIDEAFVKEVRAKWVEVDVALFDTCSTVGKLSGMRLFDMGCRKLILRSRYADVSDTIRAVAMKEPATAPTTYWVSPELYKEVKP
tara:strand:- start:2869 stop:3420 length:552 start_codon:yes stop_codon:yes gene_type:complete